MKILIGSENPVKQAAVHQAFSRYFSDIEVIGIKVSSQVSDQPFDEETFTGAWNRAKALLIENEEQKRNADFFVGIEGGIFRIFGKHFVSGVACIMDASGKTGFGTSSQFEIPERFIAELKNGLELGHLVNRVSGQTDTKLKGGATGFFTKDVIQRKEYYVGALIMAIVPFIHKEIFFNT